MAILKKMETETPATKKRQSKVLDGDEGGENEKIKPDRTKQGN